MIWGANGTLMSLRIYGITFSLCIAIVKRLPTLWYRFYRAESWRFSHKPLRNRLEIIINVWREKRSSKYKVRGYLSRTTEQYSTCKKVQTWRKRWDKHSLHHVDGFIGSPFEKIRTCQVSCVQNISSHLVRYVDFTRGTCKWTPLKQLWSTHNAIQRGTCYYYPLPCSSQS